MRFAESPPPSLTDAWLAVHGVPETQTDVLHLKGITFSVSANPLARAMSVAQCNERFDRVFLQEARRHSGLGWLATSASLFGRGPAGAAPDADAKHGRLVHGMRQCSDSEIEQFPSDHFGVKVDLVLASPVPAASPEPSEPAVTASVAARAASVDTEEMRARKARLAELQPDRGSAVAILPPAEACESIQAIRSAHDPAYRSWPPHITLMWKFVPDLSLALSVFQDALDSWRGELLDSFGTRSSSRAEDLRWMLWPIRVRLARFTVFRHASSATLVLEPDADSALQIVALRSRFASLAPLCATAEGGDSHEYRPHLSVAKFSSESEAVAARDRWQASWQPVEFEVRAVDLMGRDRNLPHDLRVMLPVHRLPIDPEISFQISYTLCLLRHFAKLAAVECGQETELAGAVVPFGSCLLLGLVGGEAGAMELRDRIKDVDVVVMAPPGTDPISFLSTIRNLIKTDRHSALLPPSYYTGEIKWLNANLSFFVFFFLLRCREDEAGHRCPGPGPHRPPRKRSTQPRHYLRFPSRRPARRRGCCALQGRGAMQLKDRVVGGCHQYPWEAVGTHESDQVCGL
jgi:2'-5' RNA ligase